MTSGIIAPSLLACDFARLAEEVEAVEEGGRRLASSRRDGRAVRAQHHFRCARGRCDQRKWRPNRLTPTS